MNKANYVEEDELIASDIELLSQPLVEPESLDSEKKRSIKARILNRITKPCPPGGFTVRAADAKWHSLTDKIDYYILRDDDVTDTCAVIWRLQPGASIAEHHHPSEEECLVLEGTVNIGDHKLYAGDFHCMLKDSHHPVLSTDSGALLYIKTKKSDDYSWVTA